MKTDARDAERLANCCGWIAVSGVRVPGPAEGAAQDLVQTREDARGDLMRAGHRLSKMLLRQGIVGRRRRVDRETRTTPIVLSRR